jgi:hypothetical protein
MPRKDLSTQRKIFSFKTIVPALGFGLAGLFTPWLRLPNPLKALLGFFMGGTVGYFFSGSNAISIEPSAELPASSQSGLASEQRIKASHDTESSQQKPAASVDNTQQPALPTTSLQQQQTSVSVATVHYPTAWKDFISRMSPKQAYIIFKLLAKNLIFALLQNSYQHALNPQEPKHNSCDATIQAHQGVALINKYLNQQPANLSDKIPDGTVLHRAEAFYIAYKSVSNGGLLTENVAACTYFKGERDLLKGPQSQPTPRPT